MHLCRPLCSPNTVFKRDAELLCISLGLLETTFTRTLMYRVNMHRAAMESLGPSESGRGCAGPTRSCPRAPAFLLGKQTRSKPANTGTGAAAWRRVTGAADRTELAWGRGSSTVSCDGSAVPGQRRLRQDKRGGRARRARGGRQMRAAEPHGAGGLRVRWGRSQGPPMQVSAWGFS